MTTSETTPTTFADLGVPDDLCQALKREGIHQPFAIQVTSIADALEGADICGKAPTGSGKTLAFSVPVAARVGQAKPRRPRALILTPTRELAAQIERTLVPLARVRGRRVQSVYGGTNINNDIRALQKGVDVLVATPGRLEDLIQRRDADLRDVNLVVLDEADQMADMGFLPVVTRLLDQTSERRQTLLFSATLDGDVDVLVRRYQNDPRRHEVLAEAEDEPDIRHFFWPADRADRRRLTADVIRHAGSAIVFTRTKHGADRLARQLAKDGLTTAAIHGNRSQNQRERALSQFAAGTISTLVATDVAARGIHIDDVPAVIHFDIPGSDKDYTHRSGRTGRAGSRGVVVTLVMDEQQPEIAKMQRSLALPQGLHRPDVGALDAARDVRPSLPISKRASTAPAGKPAPRNRGRSNRRGRGAPTRR